MKIKEIYKVKNSKVILEVLSEDEALKNIELEKLIEQTEDATKEKHVPYVEEKEDGYLIKVGKEMEHPMLEAHYIEFIELQIDEYLYRKYLKAGEKPEAYFKVPKGKNVVAREYCNIHGLWRS